MNYILLTILALVMFNGPLFAVGGDMGGGDGSEVTPYVIEDYNDFQVFCDPCNSSTYWAEGVHTRLGCDLDVDPAVTGLPAYTGSVIDEFHAIFDGNSFVISNLSIDSVDSNLGLFGQIIGDLAEVKNLGLGNASVTGGVSSVYIGALCGYKDGGMIENCYATGNVSGGSSSERLGGLCGFNYKGSIRNSYSTCSVTGSEDLGGLCGKISYGDITDCYAMGTVTGISSPIRFGGFCGFNYDANMTNCYSTGLVTWTGAFYTGRDGFCAYNTGTIAACFWDVETSTFGSAGDISNGAIGKTTAEMQEVATFVGGGWDFDPNDGDAMDWFMQTNDYPKLVWQFMLVYSGESSLSLAQNKTGQIQIDIFSPVDELVDWSISGHESCGWITGLAPAVGSSTGLTDKTTVAIDVNSAGLALGDYSCELTITADSCDTINVPISLSVYNRVDLEEFAWLAQFWQRTDCNEGQPCADVDWFTDEAIDNLDLHQLAVSWLGEEIIYALPEISDDFETGDLTALDWVVTGDANWAVVSESVNGGVYVAESGSIVHNQTTSIELTVDVDDYDTISFFRKVSSENNWDYLRFYIDDVEIDKWSGEQAWAQESFAITTGQHTFRWTYTKDGSASNGSDLAWIDIVRLFDSSQ